MVEGDIIVSWNVFKSTSLEIMRNLWKVWDFSDVTLAADDDKVFRAHRVILSFSSSMLRKVGQNHDGSLFLCMSDIHSAHLANL